MAKKRFLLIIILLLYSYCSARNASNTHPSNIQDDGTKTVMELTSKEFQNSAPIPSTYTCDGENISPPLEWKNSPTGTKSFALICEDPDAPAGTWIHWVIYSIPPEINSLQENFPKEETVNEIIKQGINDFKKTGYDGPCPPSGTPHRYYFRLYALDINTNFPPGLTADQLKEKIEGHIIGTAELMGTYKR